MKFSWTSLRISIAGAKLSHLVQKDKIWDHGSMAEQARIIFCLVQKAKSSGNIDSLKKQCTNACYEKITAEMDRKRYLVSMHELIIKELAVMEVQPGKHNRPDMFTAFIKGVRKDDSRGIAKEKEFSLEWSFARQGDWWLLDKIITRSIY